MIKADTLRSWRRVVNKMDYHPSAERERQLIDSHLEALVKIDELTQTQRDRNNREREERNNREEADARRARALGY